MRLLEIRTTVFNNLVNDKQRSKNYYDRKLNDKNFKVGNYVFLLKGPKPGKFGNNYTGPRRILEVISKNNIKIKFKGNSKVVHANRLKVSHINQEIKVRARQKHSEDE